MTYREACFRSMGRTKISNVNCKGLFSILLFAGLSCVALSCESAPKKSTPNPKPVKEAPAAKVEKLKAKENDDKKALEAKKKKALEDAKKADRLKREAEAKKRRERTELDTAKKKYIASKDRWLSLSKLWKEKGDASVLTRIKLSASKAQDLEKSKDYANALAETNQAQVLYQNLISALDAKILAKLNAEKDATKAAKEQFETLVDQSSEFPQKDAKLGATAKKAYESAKKVPEIERRNAILAYQRATEAYRQATTARRTAFTAWQKKQAAERASKENSKAAQASYSKSVKDVEAAKQAWLTETRLWGLKPNADVEKSGAEQSLKAKKLAEDKKFKEALTLLDETLKSYKAQKAAVFKETNERVLTARKESETARDTWRELISQAKKEFLKRPEEATKAELALSEGIEIKATRPRKAFQKFKQATTLFNQCCEKHRAAYEAWNKANTKAPTPTNPKPMPPTDPKSSPVKEPVAKKDPIKTPEDPKTNPVKEPVKKTDPVEIPKPTPPTPKTKPEPSPDLTPPPGATKIEAYTKMENWNDVKKVLSDRLLWNASRAIQDKAINMVTKKLGAGFQFVETKEYKCNGQAHRIATYKHLKSGVLLNLIPGGQYKMGSSNGDADEAPSHNVSVLPMFVGRHELRNAAWNRVATSKQSGDENSPVSSVTWNQCAEWLKTAGDGLRMPAESEWEYFCRGGSVSRYYWGDELDNSYCWNRTNTRKLEKSEQSVEAHFKSEKWNAFGLVDVSGNVFEWCADQWVENYSSGPRDQKPQINPKTPFRVTRGGAWLFSAYSCRSAFRGIERPDQAFPMHGLRVVMSLPE